MMTMIMAPFMLCAIVAISCGVLSTTSTISSVTGFSTVITRLPALQLRHNNHNSDNINNNQPRHQVAGSSGGAKTRTMTVSSLQAGIFDFLKDDTNDDDNNDNDTVVEKKKKSTAATKKNSTKNVKPVKAKAKVKAKSLFDKSQQSENSKNYTGIKRS
mmetsp:Transcript_16646/g.19199  ORF Transcript_16646/g.19199 Transcript_16646/m.19199 type:complete len:158 (-) Transcript_16646:381-854(-)